MMDANSLDHFHKFRDKKKQETHFNIQQNGLV